MVVLDTDITSSHHNVNHNTIQLAQRHRQSDRGDHGGMNALSTALNRADQGRTRGRARRRKASESHSSRLPVSTSTLPCTCRKTIFWTRQCDDDGDDDDGSTSLPAGRDRGRRSTPAKAPSRIANDTFLEPSQTAQEPHECCAVRHEDIGDTGVASVSRCSRNGGTLGRASLLSLETTTA